MPSNRSDTVNAVFICAELFLLSTVSVCACCCVPACDTTLELLCLALGVQPRSEGVSALFPCVLLLRHSCTIVHKAVSNPSYHHRAFSEPRLEQLALL